MKVINANNDVYKVFEVTGFTDIMNITKALRKLSVDGLEVLGQGACGTVYKIDDETIVKVFREHYTVDYVQREQNSSKRAFVNGIDTAIPFDLVQVDNKIGVVYEVVNSDTLKQAMVKDPEHFDDYCRLYARFIKQLHHIHLEKGELQDVKSFWISILSYMRNLLNEEEMGKMRTLLENVKDTDTFVHCDLNLGNVMVQDGKITLIDMAESSIGHPIFDLVGIYLIFKFIPNDQPEKAPNGSTLTLEQSQRLLDIFFEEYFGKENLSLREEIEKEIQPFVDLRVLQASLSTPLFSSETVNHCKEELLTMIDEGTDLHIIDSIILK